MVITHNIGALNAQRQYKLSTDKGQKSTEKLSSGYRINRAADDAAGLAISEKMRWQIKGLDRSAVNITDGISLAQIADGALHEASAILQRVRELSVQAANDTNTDTDRQALQSEIDESLKEIDRIAEATHMNGIFPLNANDEFGVDVVEAKDTTPTQVEKGVFHMDEPEISIDANGTPTTVKGFKFDLEGASIDDLDGNTFFSTCTASCDQTFAFTFDKNVPYISPTGTMNGDSLSVTIGLGGNPTMEQVAAEIGQAIKNSNLYDDINDSDSVTNTFQIGHANNLTINGSSLIFYPNYGGTANTNQSSYSANINGKKYNNIYMGSVYMNGLEEIVKIKKTSNEWGLNIQSGALSHQAIKLPLVRMSAERMGMDNIDVSSFNSAGLAIEHTDTAIEWVSRTRATFGAVQNRLEHAYNNNTNTSENSSAAESRIRDTDIAKEMVSHSISNILARAGESMMAQANQSTQSVLSLLQ